MKIGHNIQNKIIAGNDFFNIGHTLHTKVGRYITWLKAALAMHYKIPTATATDDFAIEFYGTFSANGFYLTAQGSARRVLVEPSGRLFVEGGPHITPPPELLSYMGSSEAHSLIISRAGSTISFHIDHVLAGASENTAEFTVELIGSKWAAPTGVPHFDGSLFHVNFISGFTQIGNPAGNPHYIFDKNYLVDGNHSNVVENVNAELGPELSEPSVVVTIPSVFGQGVLPNSDPVVTGVTYLYTFKFIAGPTANCIARMRTFGTGTTQYASIGDTFTSSGKAISTAIKLQGSVAGDYELSLVSVKRADGYADAINIKAINTKYYEEQDDGSLLSGNIWTKGDAVSDGLDGLWNNVETDAILLKGASYKVNFDSVGFTSGQMQMVLGATADSSDMVDHNATFSLELGPVTSTLARVRTAFVQPNAGASFTNISIRHILEQN